MNIAIYALVVLAVASFITLVRMESILEKMLQVMKYMAKEPNEMR